METGPTNVSTKLWGLRRRISWSEHTTSANWVVFAWDIDHLTHTQIQSRTLAIRFFHHIWTHKHRLNDPCKNPSCASEVCQVHDSAPGEVEFWGDEKKSGDFQRGSCGYYRHFYIYIYIWLDMMGLISMTFLYMTGYYGIYGICTVLGIILMGYVLGIILMGYVMEYSNPQKTCRKAKCTCFN